LAQIIARLPRKSLFLRAKWGNMSENAMLNRFVDAFREVATAIEREIGGDIGRPRATHMTWSRFCCRLRIGWTRQLGRSGDP
jgi:hypothetical protein